MRYYPAVRLAIPHRRAGCSRVTHPFATNAEEQALQRSFDLHVLGTPPAFVLSQDQTLRENSIALNRSNDMVVRITCYQKCFPGDRSLIHRSLMTGRTPNNPVPSVVNERTSSWTALNCRRPRRGRQVCLPSENAKPRRGAPRAGAGKESRPSRQTGSPSLPQLPFKTLRTRCTSVRGWAGIARVPRTFSDPAAASRCSLSACVSRTGTPGRCC
jgi:hypothetical protein